MSNKDNNNRTPQLRFPGFEGEWEEKTLADIAVIVNKKCPVDVIDAVTYISTENILQNYEGVKQISKIPNSGIVTMFKEGDILVSNIRPYLKKVWRAEFDGTASNDIIVFRCGNEVDKSFLSYIIKNDDFINYCMSGAKGLKMPRGDKSLMIKYMVCIPQSLAEQEKIAAFLSELDKLIEAEQEKLDALKEMKKGLMQQLFPQPGETTTTFRGGV